MVIPNASCQLHHPVPRMPPPSLRSRTRLSQGQHHIIFTKLYGQWLGLVRWWSPNTFFAQRKFDLPYRERRKCRIWKWLGPHSSVQPRTWWGKYHLSPISASSGWGNKERERTKNVPFRLGFLNRLCFTYTRTCFSIFLGGGEENDRKNSVQSLKIQNQMQKY